MTFRNILGIILFKESYTEGRILKVSSVMDKPTFNKDQLVTSTEASKRFGELRKKAKEAPQFITENGNVETVVLDYRYFESLFMRMMELEQKEEEGILVERITRLDNNPELGVPWRSIRRSDKDE